jgi:hypothetical protein
VAAFTDVCEYENICYDGISWMFLHPNVSAARLGGIFSYGTADLNKTGVVYPERAAPPAASLFLPFNAGMFEYNSAGRIHFCHFRLGMPCLR